MKKEKSKRGEIPWIVIWLILAVVVLVLFIFPLNKVFGNFNQNTDNPQSSLDAAKKSCELKCTTESYDSYCKDPAINGGVVIAKGAKPVELSCFKLESVPDYQGNRCPNAHCSSIPVSTCAGLTYICQSGETCTFAWMDSATFTAAKADLGVGKKYKEVSDVTLSVTDSNDKQTNTGKVCVKTILN